MTKICNPRRCKDPYPSALFSTLIYIVFYLVDFFQYQRTNPSPLISNVHLTELVPVCGDRADFLDGILVAHPVRKVVDPTRGRLLKRVIGSMFTTLQYLGRVAGD